MSGQPHVWLTSRDACKHLCFTGRDRLNSLYRFIEAHGIKKRYRSPRRLLLDRAELDAAVEGRGGHRRRAAMRASGATTTGGDECGL